jgi:hypothetical protein
MGTSASQRSPSTVKWERVRDLYRHPNPDPGQIAAGVVSALEPETIRGMAGASVCACLGSVLEASWRIHVQGLARVLELLGATPGPPAIQVASGLRADAERRTVAAGAASRFGDLAVDAIGTLSLEIPSGNGAGPGVFQLPFPVVEAKWAQYAGDRRYDALASRFMAHDLNHVMRYLVSRDLSEFIGTEAIPTVLVGTQLVERVGHYCRDRARGIKLGDFAEAVAKRLDAQSPATPTVLAAADVAALVDAGVSQGLQLLAGGG